MIQSPYKTVVSVVAKDPYLTHVVGHLKGETVINHEIEDWRAEMIAHTQEKYDISQRIASRAISKCIKNYHIQRGADGKA